MPRTRRREITRAPNLRPIEGDTSQRRLRIAHLCAVYPPYQGGSGTVCFNLATGLAKRGHEVEVFTMAGRGSLPDEGGVTVHRDEPAFAIGYAPVLPRIARIRDFDVVHFHHPFIFGTEMLFAARARDSEHALIATVHHRLIGDGARGPLFWGYEETWGRFLLRRADRVCALSTAHAGTVSHLRRLARTRPNALEVLSNGVDTDAFSPGPPDPARRRELGIPEDAIVAVAVAALDRAHYSKRVELAIEALGMVEDPRVHLLIAGGGELLEGLRGRAAAAGIAERVHFAGGVDHFAMPGVMRLADMLVLPSDLESFGLVLVEAMACGLPTVSTDLPGVRAIAREGVTGTLAPVGDAEALAERIDEMVAIGPEGRTRMGAAGRAECLARYGWPQLVEQLEGIYSDALEEKAASSRHPAGPPASAPGATARTARTLGVFHIAETSGPSRSLEAEFEWLAQRGDMHVSVPASGRVAQTFERYATVNVLPYGPLRLPRGLRGLVAEARRFVREVRVFRSRIRELQPELVVVATTYVPAAVLAARLEGRPVVVYAHELLGPEHRGGLIRRLTGAALASYTARLATAVVACSGTAAEAFEGRGAADVSVVYPPVGDLYADGDRDGTRERLGLGNDQPCIAAIGNISEARGQEMLVRAMPEIRRSFPDAACLIVGLPHPNQADRAYRRRLQTLARELGVADAVKLIGYDDRVADIYAAADVIVNPALRHPESFGRVAFEALVAGRPVVSTRLGAVPELLEDGRDALLIPPGDPGALASSVVRLLGDAGLRARLTEEGRSRVLSTMTPEHSLRGFQAVIDSVLERAA